MELKEKVFLSWAVGFWLVSLYFLYQTYQVIVARQHERDDYPHFADFSEALLYLGILVAMRELLTRFPLRWAGEAVIAKTAADRQERVDRFAVVTFKLLYFVLATVFGFALLIDEPWFPRSLGGAVGDHWQLFEGVPYQAVKPALKVYYMVSMGYHLHSLVYHALILPRRNDYVEMLTHHFLAIFLIGFSYMLNYLRFGSLVLFVHDLPDIPGYAVKASVVTPNTTFTLAIYAVLLAVWGYARLYVFPKDLILAVASPAADAVHEQMYGRYALSAMLIALFMMHVYWYVLFLFMGFRYLKIGKTEDIQQRIGDKKDEAEKVETKADGLKQRKAGGGAISGNGGLHVSNGASNGNGNAVLNGSAH